MERYLSLTLFFLYKVHYKLHVITEKINPFNLIHKIPFIKRKYKDLNIDIYQEINKAFGDKRVGVSILWAGGILIGLLFFLFFLLTILFCKIFSISFSIYLFHIFLCLFLSLFISYFLVFKHDHYIKYFDIFEKIPTNDRWKYYLTGSSLIIVEILLVIINIYLN